MALPCLRKTVSPTNWITVRSDSGAAGNVNWSETPNFNIKHVLDGNYSTFWQSGAYWKDQSFTFDFAEPQSMNYMIYVPRQGGPELYHRHA